MAISSFSGDVNVIAALHDNPVMDDNLTAQQFKEKFDYASGLIKAYINGTLVSAINKNIGDIAANTSAIAGKQNTLTFDNAPASGSDNPVKSGGIYTALAGKQNGIIVAAISLTATWTEQTNDWTQTVTVTGATPTANSKIDLQADSTAISQMVDDGCVAIYIENNNGTLTAHAVGAPTTAALTIQCTVTEVTA